MYTNITHQQQKALCTYEALQQGLKYQFKAAIHTTPHKIQCPFNKIPTYLRYLSMLCHQLQTRSSVSVISSKQKIDFPGPYIHWQTTNEQCTDLCKQTLHLIPTKAIILTPEFCKHLQSQRSRQMYAYRLTVLC